MNNLKKLCTKIEPVGSRVTCFPAPTDTDEDFLVLVSQNMFWNVVAYIEDDGYELGGSVIAPVEQFNLAEWEGFQSYKKGDINLIITCCEAFFEKFMKATRIAKDLNLLVKQDRIDLFQTILYGD